MESLRGGEETRKAVEIRTNPEQILDGSCKEGWVELKGVNMYGGVGT